MWEIYLDWEAGICNLIFFKLSVGLVPSPPSFFVLWASHLIIGNAIPPSSVEPKWKPCLNWWNLKCILTRCVHVISFLIYLTLQVGFSTKRHDCVTVLKTCNFSQPLIFERASKKLRMDHQEYLLYKIYPSQWGLAEHNFGAMLTNLQRKGLEIVEKKFLPRAMHVPWFEGEEAGRFCQKAPDWFA